MEEISVKIEVFEGPMDLLIHLISKNKIDIYDIPISIITSQYMSYMKDKKIDMDNISEFIVMAATLLEIKIKMLLPKIEIQKEENEDPRRELVEKLLEYKMFKYISNILKKKSLLMDNIFYTSSHIPQKIAEYVPKSDPVELLDTITMSHLEETFLNVMKKYNNKIDPIRYDFKSIKKDEITIDECIEKIIELLKNNEQLSFFNLFDENSSKFMKIMTFLALLELIKMNRLKIRQNRLFDDIFITKKVE